MNRVEKARDSLRQWQQELKQNYYTTHTDFIHTINFYHPSLHAELEKFGEAVATALEPVVAENNLSYNLPRVEQYDAIGDAIHHVVHDKSYAAAGDIIYGSQLMAKMAKPGGLLEALSFLYLSAHTGEAGHNCPIACSAGIIRVLTKVADIPNREFLLKKLTTPSFQANFTGAQFLTEIQGGSDVGLNATHATKDEHDYWRVTGEKWFCSNANADLLFITARSDKNSVGTKGLSLFMIPALWDGKPNHYFIRRLKEKIGTRTMATGEIDFHSAYAYLVGPLEEGFHLVMDNVLHLSRMFNTICVLGMAHRAYTIARTYAKHRIAFDHILADYPLIQENLARIKAENTAMMAAIFATIALQDKFDLTKQEDKETKLLLRLLINMLKYISALWSVEHIHHALDVLAGEGTIESFSAIPRLLRDCIVCENWEGTHNVLRMQIMRDIFKYHIDELFLTFMNQTITDCKLEPTVFTDIENRLQELRASLTTFKEADAALQTLLIKDIVDQMVILYCALMLLIEANSKEKSKQKHYASQYFMQIHVRKKKTYNKDYLALIKHVIE